MIYASLRMTGDERTNPAKALLLRMVPAGLITYLKHTPLDEGQKEVLDDIEYEYYAQYMNNASVLLSRPHIGAASLHSQVNTIRAHDMYYVHHHHWRKIILVCNIVYLL